MMSLRELVLAALDLPGPPPELAALAIAAIVLAGCRGLTGRRKGRRAAPGGNR
jgi:hypothetical protein